jgi:hypothetical protein
MFDRHWNQQPPLGTSLDQTHPLATGLISVFPFNQ